MNTTPQPQMMDVDDLSDACMKESAKFFRDEISDDRYCYELFRRALKLQNQHAWESVWKNYRNLVSGWVRNNGSFETANMSVDELVTLSFEKFWHAICTGRTFDGFPSLQALLQYLRTCCASAVTDSFRRHKHERFLIDIDDALSLAGSHRPEGQLIEDEERTLFWEKIQGLLQNESERLLIHSYFVIGLKPRQIQERYSGEFPAIQDVYRVKRNIMNRLKRADDLQDYWRD